jgi:DNA-binding MarR family transcriptional regulator
MNQLYDEAMAPIGLTAAQGRLLGEIDRMAAAKGEGPALQVLAGLLGVQISALTHALRPLVRDGLVKVRIDAHDRRTKHAVLTALGSERLGRAVALWQEANARVEAVLGPSAEMLRELAEQVSSEAFLEAYRAGKRIPAQCDKKGPA